ncbi:MAG: hypothetical protein ABSD49_05460 [Candidatus Bathyarchaeia archaeon]
MATRVSTLKFKNIGMMQVEDSDQEEPELRLQARGLGRELRLEKEEIAAITEPCP